MQLYLKSVLNGLCIYNKRGPHKNTFELKAEYKYKKKDAVEEGDADKSAASEADKAAASEAVQDM